MVPKGRRWYVHRSQTSAARVAGARLACAGTYGGLLRLAGLPEQATTLAALPELTASSLTGAIIRIVAASKDAAWETARSGAIWKTTGATAGNAAGVAARCVAWDVAWDASWTAAWAADANIAPTRQALVLVALQDSAFALLDRMIACKESG